MTTTGATTGDAILHIWRSLVKLAIGYIVGCILLVVIIFGLMFAFEAKQVPSVCKHTREEVVAALEHASATKSPNALALEETLAEHDKKCGGARQETSSAPSR